MHAPEQQARIARSVEKAREEQLPRANPVCEGFNQRPHAAINAASTDGFRSTMADSKPNGIVADRAEDADRHGTYRTHHPEVADHTCENEGHIVLDESAEKDRQEAVLGEKCFHVDLTNESPSVGPVGKSEDVNPCDSASSQMRLSIRHFGSQHSRSCAFGCSTCGFLSQLNLISPSVACRSCRPRSVGS